MKMPLFVVLRRLREGKRQLRHERLAMTSADKVRQVVALQKATLPMIRRRRKLEDWEAVWPLRQR